MTAHPRTRFVSRSRQAGVSEADRLAAWALFIGQARDLSRRAMTLQTIPPHEATALRATVVRLKASDFPVEYASARAAAESVLTAARGFVEAARPEDRAAMGELLHAGASCLDGFLARRVIDASAHWRRQLGEADE